MIFVYRVILILILIWQIQRIHLHLIMIDKCYLNFVPQISAQIGGYVNSIQFELKKTGFDSNQFEFLKKILMLYLYLLNFNIIKNLS